MDFVGNNLQLHVKQQYATVFTFLPLMGEYESEGLCGTNDYMNSIRLITSQFQNFGMHLIVQKLRVN
jgi:hypothetical protein